MTQRAFLMGYPSARHQQKGVIIVKSGAIICISGKVPEGWTVEDSLKFKETTANFCNVRIVTPGISAFMMNRLWLKLVLDGVTDIDIATAEFTHNRRLQLKPDSVKFYLVGMN
jgi:hypothetical protein